MELIEDYYTSSAWSFMVEGNGLDEEETLNLFERMGIDKKKFDDGTDGQGYSDEDIIHEFMDARFPEREYFVLLDYIDDNDGYFHIRVWKK